MGLGQTADTGGDSVETVESSLVPGHGLTLVMSTNHWPFNG